MLVLQVVVSFEGLNEFHQDLLFGFFPLKHVRVTSGIVEVLDIVYLKVSIAVSVNFMESSLNQLPSVVVELSSNGHKELVNIESAVVIGIKDVKNERHILLVDANFEVFANFRKLILRNALRAIIVHNGKELLKAYNTPSASGLDLISEKLDELLRVRCSISGPHRYLGSLSLTLSVTTLIN